ncbi:MAG: hypothetical protein P4L50_26980 [Anaerolineaceae bacterium]|nr:hypothetical protein [Anaerolineaceae bacterium]
MGISAVSSITTSDAATAAQIKSSKADSSSAAARPPPAAGGTPPPPPAASKTSSTTSITTSSARIYDKRDLNKDGKVSSQEMIQYAIKHPAASTQTAAATAQQQSQANYDQRGKLSNSNDLLMGNINTSA